MLVYRTELGRRVIGCALGCAYRVDFVIAGSLLLELKAVDRCLPVHDAQVLTYLKLMRLQQAFLINFNVRLLKQGIKSFSWQPHLLESRPMSQSERRRYPRFAASEKLAGHLLDADLPVRVRDIGLGGFSIETMEPLEAGTEHRVRFVSRDDWSTVLPATIANTRPSCADDGSPLFVSGFAFKKEDAPETKQTVQVLIEKVTSVRLYDHES